MGVSARSRGIQTGWATGARQNSEGPGKTGGHGKEKICLARPV